MSVARDMRVWGQKQEQSIFKLCTSVVQKTETRAGKHSKSSDWLCSFWLMQDLDTDFNPFTRESTSTSRAGSEQSNETLSQDTH